MKRKVFFKYIIALYCILFQLTVVFSEEKETNTSTSSSDLATELAIRAQMAMATTDYMVTAGDIYSIGFLAGTTEVKYSFIVDSSYKVRVINLGVINAAGLSYLELKRQIETIVNKNYPLSGIQFALTTPATFNITLRGEVSATTTVSVWGLSRLSEVLTNLTSSASLRDIEIASRRGTKDTYDFFRSQRFGELDQNPYLRPGDVITVRKASRAVTISGGINRPGSYQLLDGENLSELINMYGDGLTAVADPSRIELIRYVKSGSVSGDKVYLDEKAIDENYKLENYDTVAVGLRTDLIPVMYIEGAVGVNETSSLQISERKVIRFNAGEDYASIVRKNRSLFTSISDTAHAYIIRGDERISINLNPMLYDPAYRSSQDVMAEDILVVPFRQFFVTVTGAVVNPGRYAYIPDRNWEYYIALAGGFDKEKNAFESITITDINGKRRSKKDPVMPETIIDANNSTFVYYFNKYSPVIVTTLAIIVSYYTARDAISNH